jgi:hypothetical protein
MFNRKCEYYLPAVIRLDEFRLWQKRARIHELPARESMR